MIHLSLSKVWPPDYIQSLFAMPLFNWDASSVRHAMSNHFWIYWAVTLPLTALVMAVVTVFAIFQARKNRVDVDKARQSADGKLVA